MEDKNFFNTCLDIILKWETDKYTDDPNDLGGATKYGITQKTLASYRGTTVTKDDVRNLTYKEASNIYKKLFWDPCNCDLLPKALALLVFDGCINQSGLAIRKSLQQAIGGIVVDGNIGPRTAAEAAKRNIEEVMIKFMTLRALRYADSSTFAFYGRGWFNRMFDVYGHAVKLSTLSTLNK